MGDLLMECWWEHIGSIEEGKEKQAWNGGEDIVSWTFWGFLGFRFPGSCLHVYGVDCMYNELALNGFGWVFPPQSQP